MGSTYTNTCNVRVSIRRHGLIQGRVVRQGSRATERAVDHVDRLAERGKNLETIEKRLMKCLGKTINHTIRISDRPQ